MRRLLPLLAVGTLGLVLPASASAEVVTLYNQSFEDPKLTLDPDAEPKPSGWIWTGDFDTGTTFERVADPAAPDGDWILRVNSSGFEGLGGVHSPSLEVAPEGTYTVRMMVRVPVGRPLWPAISEREADDTQILFDEGPAHIGTGEWELLEYTREFEQPNGVKLRAYWRMGGGDGEPGTFYLDAVPPPAPPPPPPPPASAPIAAVEVDAAPVVSNFGMTRRLFAPVGGPGSRKARRGTYFTYDLSERALVAITVFRRLRRVLAPVVTIRARQQPGQQFMAFSGRKRKKALAPGRYRARIVATDAAGQTSRPRYVGFRIAG